jgi:hypothetical protein
MITTTTGDCYFTLQYNGDVLDSAKSIDSWLLKPSLDYKYFCYFTAGQSASLVDGVSLTGQTSGAVIKVGRVITTGGALGSSTGTGVLIFQKVSGQIVSGENLRVSTTTYCVAGSASSDMPLGQPVRSLFLSVETNSIRFTVGNVAPTNSAGTPASFGTLLKDTQTAIITSWKDCSNFKMINAVSTSNASVSVDITY